ncbi:MAG: LTA synthase family protein [Candidatus Adiutrix sp.]|nr:LTA synthase family protein [Candidatus Adiutrix sp.]
MSRPLLEGLGLTFFWGCLIALHRRESGIHGRPGPVWADAFLLATGLPLFSALSALTGRPVWAAGLLLGPALLLYYFNRIKITVLHEPLVFADIQMARQLFFFPSFYWPYIPLGPLLAGSAALLIAGLTFRRFVEVTALSGPARLFCGLAAILAALAWSWFVSRAGERTPLTGSLVFEPTRDGRRYGLIGAAVLGGIWQNRFGLAEIGAAVRPAPDGLAEVCAWPRHLRRPLERGQPHVIVVQAESFFHLRRLWPDLGPAWTANFDRLSAEGRPGRLGVTAYGAYTVRTEFAVLTGLAGPDLRSFQFNPYALAAKTAVGGLPRWLTGQGYEAVCIHPGAPAFLRRDRALPNLGFHRFLARDEFKGARRFGPYIADAAIAERLKPELPAGGGPKFIFIITLEAHGPWPSGRLAGQPDLKDIEDSFGRPGGLDEGMLAYARHLRNADSFLGELAGLDLDRPLLLGWYGDHVGSLPRGLKLDDEQSAATDFLIWHSSGSLAVAGPVAATPLPPEHFGTLLLTALHEYL